MKNHKILIIIFLAISILCFIILNISPQKFYIPAINPAGGIRLIKDNHDMSYYYQKSVWWPEKKMPYREISQEYPQLAILYLTLPRFFTNNFSIYQKIFYLFNIICYFVLLYITGKMLKIINKDIKYLILFLLPSFLYFVFNRYDIFPVFLIQLSLFLLLKKRYYLSIIFLSFAFLAKWYAILFLPIYLIYLSNKLNLLEFKLIRRNLILIFLLIITIPILITIFWAGTSAAVSPYIFQLARDFEQGGTFFIYIRSIQSLLPSSSVNFFSQGFLFLLLILQFFVPLLMIIKSSIFKKYIISKDQLIYWMALVILIFIIFSKFYSPQWILWFLPFLILIVSSKEIILLVAYDIINYIAFPLIYDYLGSYSIGFDMITLARSILLIWLIWLLIKKIFLNKLITSENNAVIPARG